ncbi:aldolase [Xylophilus sp. Kf1]|nr:aldolase [Xylophilus sp. Kf1]
MSGPGGIGSRAENHAREEICRVGRSLFERGRVHATAGNISVRLEDGFLITPTDACLGFLDPARLARLDAEGRQLTGDRASKTLALHMRVYAAARRHDPATACVLHSHATHCVALTLPAPVGAELLPALTPYFVMKVGRVPVIDYHRPGAAEAADAVSAAIDRYGEAGTPIRCVMLPRLGPIVWHETSGAAMAVLEELEETARLQLLAPAGTLPLDEGRIDELRHAFGARW